MNNNNNSDQTSLQTGSIGGRLIITIGRQLGSGGRIIARRLAEEFDCTFYDKELLARAAHESGFSEEFFEQSDEHKGFFRSLLQHHGNNISLGNFYRSPFSEDSLFQIQSDAIQKAADEGPCVFVGRCADYVLRDRPNVVSIFITAPIEDRIRRVQERHSCTAEEARRIIHKGESQRAAFYNYYTAKRWGHAASYDLSIDSSQLGIDETTMFIAEFVRRKLKNDK